MLSPAERLFLLQAKAIAEQGVHDNTDPFIAKIRDGRGFADPHSSYIYPLWLPDANQAVCVVPRRDMNTQETAVAFVGVDSLHFDDDKRIPEGKGYSYQSLIALQLLGSDAPVEMPVVEVHKGFLSNKLRVNDGNHRAKVWKTFGAQEVPVMIKDTETIHYLRSNGAPVLPATFFQKNTPGIEIFPLEKMAEYLRGSGNAR